MLPCAVVWGKRIACREQVSKPIVEFVELPAVKSRFLPSGDHEARRL